MANNAVFQTFLQKKRLILLEELFGIIFVGKINGDIKFVISYDANFLGEPVFKRKINLQKTLVDKCLIFESVLLYSDCC